jgi:translation initiation factor 1
MSAERPFHNPFGALKGLVPAQPAASPAPEAPKAGVETRPLATGTIPRAVVRMERAGRGGKDVTVVSHLDLKESERTTWLKSLKASLGCGGVVEGDTLVLQGDHRERLPALLTARGVKKVTIG